MDEIKNITRLIDSVFPKIILGEIVNPFRYPFILQLFIMLVAGLASVLIIFNVKSIVSLDNRRKYMEQEMVKQKHEIIKFPDIEAIITTINSRKLFKSALNSLPLQKSPEISRTGPGISEQLKQLVFLGILGGQPEQAIIESKTTGETYYIKEGEVLFDLEVTAIDDDQVTFQYQGEKGVLK